MRAKLPPIAVLACLLVAALAPTAVAQPLVPYQPDATVPRDQVPDVYKWDLSPLFASDAAWDSEVAELGERIPGLSAYEGRLDDAKALLEALELYFDLHNRVNHTTMYAGLRLDTDLAADELQAMHQRAQNLLDQLQQRAGFLRAGILGIDDRTMAAMLAAEPGLQPYEPYLDNLRRRRDRVLGPEAERVLALAGDNLWAEIDLNEIPSPLEDAFGALLTDIPWPLIHDEEGDEVQLTLANYGRFRASPDRAVRREAVEAFMRTLYQYRHALAATLAGQFALDVTYSRARGYDTALEAYLDKDDIQTAVYDNLVTTVENDLEPLHRYVELRKRALGLDTLHLYDLYVPLVASVDEEIPFLEARRTVIEALQPLGDRYVEVLSVGLDPRNGWIDVYPSRNKESGAFSSSVYGCHPYVLMNYQDSLDDMSTLAHEYGHALHSYLAMEAQPYPSYRYAPFLAEIASTCNEVLLSDHLTARAEDPARKAYLLTGMLESIRTTIYRQTLFAEFERQVHGYIEDGTPVTADLLRKTYGDLIARYYGPGFTVDEYDDMEWAYIPHFYYKYYVYNYATGLASGIAIARRVRDLGQPAVDAYLAMLSGGSSRPPLDLLREAGVDLTRPDAVESALGYFAATLDELAGLLPAPDEKAP